ncbi:MAG TPA: zf-HC2 domain-containing protein [Myxococcaceae bacterium]|nr:zf-HC2 domain-containing protein [Myxococcaceae bacterium]
MMASNPACQSYLPLLSPFIDGELSPAERQTVERHLAACPDCTARVADLRAESALVRLGMEMLADEADFTGFAQKVMARVTPEKPPLLERWRLATSEMFRYQRGALMTAAASIAVAVLGVILLTREGTPTGYRGERIAVENVQVDESAHVSPVVLNTDDGNAIIWLVSRDGAKKKDGGPDEESEEEIGGPAAAPMSPAGDSSRKTPRGGEL